MSTSAVVATLLGRLVDRLDQAEKRGSAKARAVPLTEAFWPEFFNSPYQSELAEHWKELQSLAARGWLEIRPEHRARSASGYADGVSVSVVDVLAVRAAVGRPLRALSSLERWRQAVSDHLDAPDDVRIRVSDYPLDVAGHAPEDVVRRLAQLRGLGDSPLLLREVSSRLFWGMSKVLDGKQDLVCALLQAEECPFPESPIQLLAHLPVQAVRGYLFIENQATFEGACRGGFEGLQGLVLLYSAGFKASAARLRRPEGSSLYLSDASPNTREVRAALRAWLYRDGPIEHTPVAFWGDLDWSGMQILASLRMSFPEAVAWEPGYRALLNVLEEGGGHLPAAADKTGQRVVASTGCSFADATLLPALARAGRFVDQEWADLAVL